MSHPNQSINDRRRLRDVWREQRREAAERRDAFAREFGVSPGRWGPFNLARMLSSTGERPKRVAEMRSLLAELGMGYPGYSQTWIQTDGVFDHGELWCRAGHPVMVVGHPYGIADEAHCLLRVLGRYGTLRVSVDDRQSYYGARTHHVRIDVSNPTTPYRVPRSTRETRRIARLARAAFAEEMEGFPW